MLFYVNVGEPTMVGGKFKIVFLETVYILIFFMIKISVLKLVLVIYFERIQFFQSHAKHIQRLLQIMRLHLFQQGYINTKIYMIKT